MSKQTDVAWNPWRTLATRYSHVTVVCEHELPRGIAGLWRDDTIWLCRNLTQAERRSVLTHELIHIERGLPPRHLLAREEDRVDELAARRLVRLTDLARGLHWTSNAHELAEELWTDAHTIRVRLDTLTAEERAWLTNQFTE